MKCWWHMPGGKGRVISAAEDAVDVHSILVFRLLGRLNEILRLVLAAWCIAGYSKLGRIYKECHFPIKHSWSFKATQCMQLLQQPSHYPGQCLVLRLECIQSTR